MKYKITIEQVTEYPEMQTVYESKEGGTRYFSKYHEDIETKKVNVVTKEYPTGKMLTRKDEIYMQEFDTDTITAVIKAVNGI